MAMHGHDYEMVVIGGSAGSPLVVQDILAALSRNFPFPIFIVQHMPADQVADYARRLDHHSTVEVRVAEEGDTLVAGLVLVAPGGMQTLVHYENDTYRLRLTHGGPEQHYCPSIDVSFASVMSACRQRVLAIILSGMGEDGHAGAQLLKQMGATIWTQDSESCAVYGMPALVTQSGLADRELSVEGIGRSLIDIQGR